MMTQVQCAVCGEDIDRGACNQEFGIFTVVSDSDETGTKHERKYLCENHINVVELAIDQEIMDRAKRLEEVEAVLEERARIAQEDDQIEREFREAEGDLDHD